MVDVGGIVKGLMIYAVLTVLIDTSLPMIFPEVDILKDFSIVLMLQNVLYIVGSLIGLAAYTLQRITTGDFLSPLNLFIRVLMAFAFIFIGGAVDLFFSLVVLPFNLLSDFARIYNVPTAFVIPDVAGQYISFDLATFTVRVGFKLSVLGNGARATFQISLLGARELVTPNKGFTFPESGFIGVYARLRLSAVGVVLKSPPFDLELEKLVKGLVNTVFKDTSSPQTIYQEIIEYLKELGWIN